MLFASIIIYLVFSLYIYPRIFEKATFSKILLVFYLCTFSINISTSEILGVLQLLNHPWLFLGIQAFSCIVLSVIIQRISPLSIQLFQSTFGFSNIRLSKVQIMLVSLISVALIGFFVVGITTPINNNDSLATHLPRIYYWLQHGSFDYWTASNQWQLIYPINAHIQGLWFFLFGKSENLFFLVQWFSLLIITVSIFEICKSLGFSTTQALMSGLISLSLPVVLLQVFSFQGDLTVTALLMVCINFLLFYSYDKVFCHILAACLCVILALGTKQTAFLVLPTISMLILYLLVVTKGFKKFITSSWVIVVFLAIFASFQFTNNLVHTGSLFGLDSLLTDTNTSFSQIGEKAKFVIPRYAYQFLGFDGLPRSIQPSLLKLKENIFKAIFDPLGLDLENEVFLQPGYDQNERFFYTTPQKRSEDTAWFGPLAFLLIPISTLISFTSKSSIRKKYAFLCLINSTIFLILLIVQRAGWDPYQGRYFILALIPFLPLVSMLLPKNRSIRGVIIGILSATSLLLISNSLLFNESKPIITAKTQNDIINNFIMPLSEKSSAQQILKKALLKIAYPNDYSIPLVNIYEATYFDQLYYSNNSTAKDIIYINNLVPDVATISIMVINDPLEYALFGRNRSRMVNPIAEMSDVDQGYLLVSNSLNLIPTSEMKLLGNNQHYSIYYIETN